MENSILIALSRQVTIKDQMDIIANNIANLKTTGFKASNLLFREFIMPRAKFNGLPENMQKISYVAEAGVVTDFSQGGLIRTGAVFDLAIEGEGFFVIETPEGTAYTRVGNFKRDAEGNLVTQNGHRLQSKSGDINIAAEENNIVIAKDGTVSTDSGVKGQIKIVIFDKLDEISRQQNGIYTANNEPEEVEDPRIEQYMLEQSNVQAVREMANMIEVIRKYSRINSIIESSHELKKKAINQMARIEV